MNFSSPKDAMDHGFALITEERKANGLFLKGDITFNTTIANMSHYKSGVCDRGSMTITQEITDLHSLPNRPTLAPKAEPGGFKITQIRSCSRNGWSGSGWNMGSHYRLKLSDEGYGLWASHYQCVGKEQQCIILAQPGTACTMLKSKERQDMAGAPRSSAAIKRSQSYQA